MFNNNFNSSRGIFILIIVNSFNRFTYLFKNFSDLPIVYPTFRIIIYCGSAFSLFICFIAINSRKNLLENRSLRLNSPKNLDLIKKSRALQEFLRIAKLILSLVVIFTITFGSQIIFQFFIEVSLKKFKLISAFFHFYLFYNCENIFAMDEL